MKRDLKKYIRKLHEKHPNWSSEQLSKRALKDYTKDIIDDLYR